MNANNLDNLRSKLATLETALRELESKLPERTAGRTGLVSAHHASLSHWQKIAELEDEIHALKQEIAKASGT